MVDAATRWPEAIPIKGISIREVAQALLGIFVKRGIPKQVLSDNGKQFVSNAMNIMGIERMTSTPYHPQSNGMVERPNGSLKKMLNELVEEKPITNTHILSTLFVISSQVIHLA
ncbi:Pol polyprotein [Plakobranchus ocellatus]|uniref:Pol polyprotein n=1 Tax=Plakobranchus ocellatus TaxID=259542 RepID=A0AAV4A542_9GAST|nr:Pol polyprotein [Plakobranchus ocellatus]